MDLARLARLQGDDVAGAEGLLLALDEAQAEAVGEVYWTRFGKSYHFDRNCPYIADKTPAAEGGTLYAGSLDDAFAANRWDPCDTCAGGAQAKIDEAATGDTTTTDTTAEQPAG